MCCVCGVLDHLAPAHRCARSVCFAPCAVSLATWLLITGVPARCFMLRVRCPWPLRSCSALCPLGVLCCACGVLSHSAPVHRLCPLGVLCCVCGVLGRWAPVHRCGHPVCYVARAVSLATCLLFSGVPTRCIVLCVPCPWPLDSCSPLCPLGVLCCLCGVSLATWLLFTGVHPRGAVCEVSLDTWLLFTGVPAWCVVLRVRCGWPLGP